MNILVLTKNKKHSLQYALQSLGTVIVSETPVECDVCFITSIPKLEHTNKLGSTPLILYLEEDPLSVDIDSFLYTTSNTTTPYKLILLLDSFQASKTYVETRYPAIPVQIISPFLPPYSNKLYEGNRESTEKLNIIINGKNTNFADNSWRQLCIAEHMFHQTPNLINDIYLFNAPTNKTAIDMYENLEIFKQKKLRTFIQFESYQIVQHFNLQPHRSVYLMNSVADTFDPLALYCLQNKIGVVHTSEYLKQNNLGKFYKSYDFGTASECIKAYLAEPFSTDKANEVCKKLSDSKSLQEIISVFQNKPIQTITSKTYNPKDVKTPLLIGYDNILNKDPNTNYFINTVQKNNWEYAIVSMSEKWNGFTDKVKGIQQFLQTLPEDKIVVVSDTRDVVCCRTSKQFMQAFTSKQTDFLVSMEVLCHGKFESEVPRGPCVPLTNYWKQTTRAYKPLRKFVNAGLLCGKVSAVKAFYTWLTQKGYKDDQVALGNYMNANPVKVYADDKAELLHTSNFAYRECILSHENQIQDSPTFSELFGHGAFFLHLPEQSDNGQKTMFKYAKIVLDIGASANLLTRKDFPDLDFFGNFADGSKLIVH